MNQGASLLVRSFLVVLAVALALAALPGQAQAQSDPMTDPVTTLLDDAEEPMEEPPGAPAGADDAATQAYAKAIVVIQDALRPGQDDELATHDIAPAAPDRSALERFGLGFLTFFATLPSLFGSGDAHTGTLTGTTYAPLGETASTMGATMGAVTALGLLSLLGVWVRRAGWLAAIPLFSRIEHDKLLKHPVRLHVMTFIRANPGANASEIARALDLAWGTVTHHLDKLCAGNLLAVRRVDNQKCFFECGAVDRRDMDARSALKAPTAARIALLLRDEGSTTQKSVAEVLGISRAVTSFHVRKLVDRGVVAREKAGRSVVLRLQEQARGALDGCLAQADLAPGSIEPIASAVAV